MTSLARALSTTRSDSEPSPGTEVRVLVIYTGGTIGMKYDKDGVLVPVPNALVPFLKSLPIMNDEQYAQEHKIPELYGQNTMVLPLSEQKKRIVYTVDEYSPLLDSCNMTMKDWAKIANDVEKYYEKYDGFVILHGTDTMAFTSSALSFMFDNLGKPVILTGSQIPIYELRNDGRDNLLGALLIAGQFKIPEVSLYFFDKLYRGNRVTKVDAGSFNGFTSPNLEPLVDATEVDIKVDWDTVLKPNTTEKFTVNTEMDRNVGVLRLFPGITAETVRAFLQPPMKGIVLETFGAGNAPTTPDGPDSTNILAELKKATDRGVIIINCTQCLRGSVVMTYATGKALRDAGLISGSDMTPEAALTKLSYVLAMEKISLEDKKKLLIDNLRGELTVPKSSLHLSDSLFIQSIAKALSLSCKEELLAVRDALNPTLACAAAKTGDIEALKAIREMGSSLSMEDYDGRTPLHIASCEGHLKVVEYLLEQGATVYAKDRYGDTPLRNAMHFRRKDVVKLLRQTGAHLSPQEIQAARAEMCSYAAQSDVEGLEIWALAGVEKSS
ncbi:60 kDa lysophospholipase-like [Engraulis encrasicolus]|uniref:60 kDa lysophospholipase-like n=1 Tax=Engraulis encrasicolus TaxID=184585 RepID=UPI002FD3C64B